MRDYYEILEINPRACRRVVDAAWKALSLEYGDANPKRTLLNEAHDTLSDESRRADFDEKRNKKEKKTIGNYRIISKIADGGFGVTYKGEHTLTGSPVCIKHASNVSPQDTEIMLQEAKAVWDLRHWAIPAVRDIVQMSDGSIAMVMSYVPGPTLAQMVEKNGSIEPEHVCWITERVLNALRYLHDNSVVHGDVKPQNIIIQPSTHQVVLVDYGLSLVKPTKNSANKGYTPHFASPEQEKNLPLLPESDLFSLGVTMIYALGGDVKAKLVPASTPDALCQFVKRLIVYNVLSRPNWFKEDLCKSFSDVREKCFGRRWSAMKPLKV
jgi:serine/threonine protein kinase